MSREAVAAALIEAINFSISRECLEGAGIWGCVGADEAAAAGACPRSISKRLEDVPLTAGEVAACVGALGGGADCLGCTTTGALVPTILIKDSAGCRGELKWL